MSQSRRRQFLIASGALLAAPLARAQPVGRLPKVTVILPGTPTRSKRGLDALLEGLREVGQFRDKTFVLELWYDDGDATRVPSLLRDVYASRPNVVVISGATAARLAKEAGSPVPTVVMTGSDLVEAGAVKSFAHPGGNITGVADLADETTVKRLELLVETLPKSRRIGMILNPNFPTAKKVEHRVMAAASTLRVRIETVVASDRKELDPAVDSLAKRGADALLVGPDPLFVLFAASLIEGAAKHRLPVFHFWTGTADLGALMLFGPDVLHNFRRAATYIDRILKGAKPADMAIEQPTKFELVINLKTAKSLGITIPQSILLRANRVIE